VPAVADLVHDRDGRPGQVGELGVQGGLVGLDDEHVVRAAGAQPVGVGVLGVQGVGGDHRADQRTRAVDALQQRGERRDFVGLVVDLGLAEDHAGGVIERAEQMHCSSLT
jgi:hypothetical protein